jgi:hypothetical protein
MPLSVPYSFTSNTVIEAAEMNSNFTAVKNFADGLASGVNLEDGAVTTAKIAAGAITSAKLDPSVANSLASGDSDQVVLGTQVFG